MIDTREQFATKYFQRCLAVDGFIVMKSSVEFKLGQIFITARSAMLGSVNAKLVVAGVSSAAEAKSQAKRVGNVDLRPIDMSARFYYRIAPEGQFKPYYSIQPRIN